MKAVGYDLAQHYVAHAAGMREALGISQSAPLVAEPLGQGEHNANFWFAHPETGQRFVLRINYASQLGLREQASYEYNALKVLEPCLRTPRPCYVDESRSVIDKGLLVIGFCEGEHLDYLHPGDTERAARLLADVHAVKPAEGCGLLKPADPLKEQYLECCRMFETYRSYAGAQERVVRLVDEWLACAKRSLSEPCGKGDCNHVLNTEAIAAHFLLPENDEPGYVVDWEKPVIGEAAQDVAYFLSPTTTIWDTDFIFSESQRTAFVEAYWKAIGGRFAPGSFERRFPAYVMTNCLRGVTWSAQAYVEYQDPNRPLRNEKTRAKLDEYLSEEFLTLCHERFFA